MAGAGESATDERARAAVTAADPPVGRVAFGATACALIAMAGPSAGVRDAGELTAAAFGVDVPHPTGFPADMVLMRLAMLAPAGDAGFRANVFVALAMALAAALGARLAYALAAPLAPRWRALLAAVPPVAIVASPTTLRAGTAAEVYALALAASLAALGLLAVPDEARGAGARVRLAALLAGGSVMLHTGARPCALIALAVLLARRTKSDSTVKTMRRIVRALPGVVGAGIVGAMGVLYLPFAARRRGLIDWGDPSTPARLVAHLTARRIRAAFADRILVPWRMPDDLAHAASVLGQDLGPAMLVAGVVGAVIAARDRLGRWVAVAAMVDLAYAVAINPMGIGDRQTLFVLEAGLAVLASLALARLAARVPERARGWTAAGLGLALGGLSAARFDYRHAARADGWAEAEVLEGAGALGAVPVRSVVLCESDDLCGGAFYAQRVEGERPDVVVLPRQHLADPSTWRRATTAVLGAPRPEPTAEDTAHLRVARLRALLARFGARVRWEQGESEDEQLAHVTLGTGETPVLAAPFAPVTDDDARAAEWLAPRITDGAGARSIGAAVLFAAGRRLATLDLARAEPLWTEALALDPELAPAYTNLGVVRARAGDLDAAIALSRRATELDPDRLVAWRNLARYLDARGDADGASRALAEYRRRGGR